MIDQVEELTEKKGRPNLGSAWVVIANPKTDEVLLGKRAKAANNAGQWNLFGGGIEQGEGAIQTALRELWEEGGIRANPASLKLLGREPNGVTVFVLLMDRKQVAKQLKLKANEISKAKWFDIDQLPSNLHKSTIGLYRLLHADDALAEPESPYAAPYSPASAMREAINIVESLITKKPV